MPLIGYISDSHVNFQSEISRYCFFNFIVGLNGVTIYSYLSGLQVSDNEVKSLFAFASQVHGQNNIYNSDNGEDDWNYPCNTYQKTDFDDSRGKFLMYFSNPDGPLEQNLF